jgi:starch phosphorylase
MPLHLERDSAGKPLVIEIDYSSRSVRAQIWRIQVGRVPVPAGHELEENALGTGR